MNHKQIFYSNKRSIRNENHVFFCENPACFSMNIGG